MCHHDYLFSHTDYGQGVIGITAPMGERVYLVLGNERAALIDTGMGIASLRHYVRSLTSLPLVVVNTHGHPDHAGGNSEFDTCRMHMDDLPWFHLMCRLDYRREDIRRICPERYEEFGLLMMADAAEPLHIEDGEQLDLGGRRLIAALSPGHTPGSLCLYDSCSRSLFAGDMVSGENVWLYDEYSMPLRVFYQSIQMLQSHFPSGKWCFIGHHPGRLDYSALDALKMCARRILMQDAVGTPTTTFAGQGLRYQLGSYGIIYNPEKLY